MAIEFGGGAMAMVFAGRMMGFIATVDAARARQFYEGVLRMRFVSDDGFALVMEGNGTMFRIVGAREFKAQPFTVMGWEVDGIEDAVRTMAAAGVSFERYGLPGQGEDGIWAAPGGAKVAWFKDPDGNVLSVSAHP